MKKRTKRITLVCMIGLLGVLGYVGVQLNGEATRLKANSNEEITEPPPVIIDENTDSKYTLPKDATELVDPALKGQPQFNNFVQSSNRLEYISKTNLNSHAAKEASNQVMATTKLENGNYLMAQEAYWLGEEPKISGIIISERNENGELKGEYSRMDVNTIEYIGAAQAFTLKKEEGKNIYGYAYAVVGDSAYYLTLDSTDSKGINFTNVVEPSKVGSHPGSFFYSTLVSPIIGTPSSLVSGQIVFFNKSNTSSFGYFDSEGTVLPLLTHDLSLGSGVGLPYFSPSGVTYKPISEVITERQSYDFVWPLKIKKLKNNKILVQINYHSSQHAENPKKVSTIQIFNRDAQGTLNNIIQSGVQNPNGIGTGENSLLQIQEEISTDNDIYFTMNTGVAEAETEIHHYDVMKNSFEKEKTFPEGTNLRIYHSNIKDRYRYVGYVENMAVGEWASYGYIGKKVVTGLMDKQFNLLSVQVLEANNSTTFTYMDAIGGGKYFVNGQTLATDFSNKPSTWVYNTGGEYETIGQTVFMGSLEANQDYSPAIKKGSAIKINLDDSGLTDKSRNEMGWTKLDNWLITGEKSGTLASPTAIEVFDQFDLKDSTEIKTQDWLNKRINRNPNNTSLPIDWQALGFDQTNAGPQQVTYFVTDSQKQATSTSRWINKLTDQTVEEKDYAFDAQNFAIELGKVGTDLGTNEAFKKLAKTMAWDMNSHEIYEESRKDKFDAKATINQDQLKALQEAKIAKPYPVDVTYKPDASTTIVNRVWVFVTTKNTVVDKDKRVVIYANDYSLPLRLARQETNQKVYDHTDVKVYDYHDATHETDATLEAGQLPTIADKGKNQGTLGVADLTVITEAKVGKVIPVVTHTGALGEAKAPVDVELTAIEQQVFHLRQVVVSEKKEESEQLVVPKTGHLSVKNSDTQVTNIIVPSGLETGTPAFEEVSIGLDTANNHNTLEIETIVPEYYSYAGYVLTDTDSPHVFDNRTKTGNPQTDITTNKYHFWVTVYLTPNLGEEGIARPYSWDAKVNDFGKIVP